MQQTVLEWKKCYNYYILGACCFLCYMFINEEQMTLPTWGTAFGVLFLAYTAFDRWWTAMAKSGNIACTTLGIGKGANDGINLSCDKRMATSKDQPSFACIATGGFVENDVGFAQAGKKNFIVCPPEYVQQIVGNIFIRANLRRVGLKNLPPYVQSSLGQLPKFSENRIMKHHNLWFGMTSSYYGTDTAENLKFEEEFIHKMSVESTVTHLLDEMTERKKSLEPDDYKRVRIVNGDDDD